MLEAALLALNAALLTVLVVRVGALVEAQQRRASGSNATDHFRHAALEKLHEIAASVSSAKEWGPDLATELDYRNRRRANYRTATLGEGDVLRFHAGDSPNYSSDIRGLQQELREIQGLLRQIDSGVSLLR